MCLALDIFVENGYRKGRSHFMKSRTTDVGVMVSVRISYISDDSLYEAQIMAIWPSFDSSPEFPTVAPPATLPLPVSPSWSPHPGQTVTASKIGRKARPAATSSWHVPPPYPPITLTFIQLLFLHPHLSWLRLCSTGCLPSVYWHIKSSLVGNSEASPFSLCSVLWLYHWLRALHSLAPTIFSAYKAIPPFFAWRTPNHPSKPHSQWPL